MKRTRLNPRSRKTAARIAKHGPERREWMEQFSKCMKCGGDMYGADAMAASCHEMIGGTSQRKKTFTMPAMWLALHFKCNQEYPSVPNRDQLIEQLAIKLWQDPATYDLGEVNKIWTRNGAEPITHDEILSEER